MFSDSLCALLDSCKVLIFVVFAVIYEILLIGLSLLSGLPWPESWNPKRDTSAAANGRRMERGNLGFVFRRYRNQGRWTHIPPMSKTSCDIPKIQFNQSREEPQSWILQ